MLTTDNTAKTSSLRSLVAAPESADMIWYPRKMDKNKILAAAKEELLKHSLDTFVDEPPSVAKGGKGVVVTGCPECRTKFGTVNQLMHHLSDDVLPKILRTAFAIAAEK